MPTTRTLLAPRSTAAVFLSARSVLCFLAVLALPGCPGRECLRAVRCVQVCGGPLLSSGCGACAAGTFDDLDCRDGGVDAGAEADGGGLDGGGTTLDGAATDAGARTACTVVSDCALRAATCCGVCGSPTVDDYVGLHIDDVTGYGTAVC
mgnify:CR=1 FL=1